MAGIGTPADALNIRTKTFMVWVWMGIMVAFGSPAIHADIRSVEQDTDGNGKTDQVVHLDATGTLRRLAADTDEDGRMDTVQFYENGVVVRIERDVNKKVGMDER